MKMTRIETKLKQHAISTYKDHRDEQDQIKKWFLHQVNLFNKSSI